MGHGLNVKSKTTDARHKGFEIGLLLKFIGGILEVIGAALMLLLTPDRISSLRSPHNSARAS